MGRLRRPSAEPPTARRPVVVPRAGPVVRGEAVDPHLVVVDDDGAAPDGCPGRGVGGTVVGPSPQRIEDVGRLAEFMSVAYRPSSSPSSCSSSSSYSS
jgi:hypothetical protein